MLETPILFLIFNRPDRTRLVFEAIKKVKPSKLYIVSDGARINKTDDLDLILQCRAIINEIDWNCELKTLFRDTNLGSGLGVYEGINWFFNNEENGIILEDDCLPNQSFFTFCNALLNYYNTDESIMQISGSNYLLGFSKTKNYYFSQIPLTWGWATWSRAWKKMDYQMKDFNENIKTFPEIANMWIEHWESINNGKIKDAWDFQWYYSIYCNKGIIIHPSVNLVKNIGFDSANATHTFSAPWWYKFVITDELIIEKHPDKIVINKNADLLFRKIFSNQMPSFFQRIILKIRSFFL